MTQNVVCPIIGDSECDHAVSWPPPGFSARYSMCLVSFERKGPSDCPVPQPLTQCDWRLLWQSHPNITWVVAKWFSNVILATLLDGAFSHKTELFLSLQFCLFVFISFSNTRDFSPSFENVLLWGILNMNKSRQNSVMSPTLSQLSAYQLLLCCPYPTQVPIPSVILDLMQTCKFTCNTYCTSLKDHLFFCT